MAYRKIGTRWDENMREDIDIMFKELFDEYIGAGNDASEAKEKAEQALADALLAKETAETTRDEMLAIIREQTEGGDLVPEVTQARGNHDVLGDRLNSIDQVLAQTSNQITDIHQNKASKEELYLEVNAKANRSYVDTKVQTVDGRIDDIITSPAQGVSEQEIIDSREGEASLGANVRNIRGKAEINFKNENKNGNFTKGLDGWFTQFGNVEVDGDIANLIGGSGRSGTRIYNTLNETPTNEIWYATANARTLTDGANWFSVQFRGATGATDARINNPVTGQWYSFSHYATPSDFSGLTGTFGFAISSYWNVGIDDKHVQVSELMAFNLTEIFGSGNEPSQEEMDELVDYFGYFDGDLGAGKLSRYLSESQRNLESDMKTIKTYNDSELENLIVNGDFVNDISPWTHLSTSVVEHIPGWARIKGNGTFNLATMHVFIDAEYEVEDILYVAGDFRPQNDDVNQLGFAVYSDLSSDGNVSYLSTSDFNTQSITNVSGNITVASAEGNMRVQVRTRYPSAVESDGKAVDVSRIRAFNLTRFFGKGNEPSADAFERMLSVMNITDSNKTDLATTQKAVTEYILNRAKEPVVSLNKPLAVVSFDDHNMSDYEKAYPFLRARGIRGTSYVITSRVGESGKMDWSHLKELKEAGWGIEFHSHNHINLSSSSDEVIREDFEIGFQTFLDNDLPKPRHLAYPYGAGTDSERVRNVIGEYIKTARNSRAYTAGVNNRYDDIDFLRMNGLSIDMNEHRQDRKERIKEMMRDSAENNEIVLLYAHKLVDEPPTNDNTPETIFSEWAELIDYAIDLDFEFVTQDELYLRLR